MADDEENAALTRAQYDALAGFTALDGLKLHANTKLAIEAMANEGLSLTQAADRFGIRRDNFARVLQRPEIRRAYNQLVDAIRENAAQAAYMRINDLAANAKSEHVRLKAAEWVAGVDGIAATKKVEGHMRHSVQFGGFEYSRPDTIDVTPESKEE